MGRQVENPHSTLLLHLLLVLWKLFTDTAWELHFPGSTRTLSWIMLFIGMEEEKDEGEIKRKTTSMNNENPFKRGGGSLQLALCHRTITLIHSHWPQWTLSQKSSVKENTFLSHSSPKWEFKWKCIFCVFPFYLLNSPIRWVRLRESNSPSKFSKQSGALNLGLSNPNLIL